MKQRDMNSARRDRWERENAAPRLKQLVPELESLRLSLIGCGHACNRRLEYLFEAKYFRVA